MNGFSTSLDVPLALRLPASTARKLAAHDLISVADLLTYGPRRLDQWGSLTPISSLREGDTVTILAEVLSAQMMPNRTRKGVRFVVELTDGSETITATFFASTRYRLAPHERLLEPGARMLFAGKVGSYKGKVQLTNPQFEGAQDATIPEIVERSQRLIPIYPATASLNSWTIERAVSFLLQSMHEGDLADPVPETIRREAGLPDLVTTLRALHEPDSREDWKTARAHMAWREAFTLQAGLACVRRGSDMEKAPVCPRGDDGAVQALRDSLPFDLTGSQEAAVEAISRDLMRERPMQRLLQGDVGSGKTVVSALAMCQAMDSGFQAAMLVPTEVLAEQHYQSLHALIARMTTHAPRIELFTASTPRAERRTLERDLADGQPMIVVGTHTLLQDSVTFAHLGLVVVDEQHRFGVAQRDHLRGAATAATLTIPHQLVMTATPIPRTVAMTVFGDLDQTCINELPPGRRPVSTFLVDVANAAWMQRLWERAREEIDQGGRIFVVCPRIDEGDDVEDTDAADHRPPLASVHAVAAALRIQTALRGIGIEELHGRIGSADKTRIMDDFIAGRAPVLVSTTVIEVGVDVPEATMMVIIDAQQFGLSQLHQLRGRVGRSDSDSVCMAVHRHDLSAPARERLEAFARTTDGFELARVDLTLRREGDVVGAQQSGRTSGLRFLSVSRDGDIIEQARDAARRTISADPTLADHSELERVIRARLSSQVAWMERS